MMASENPRPDHWRTEAACRGMDPAIFFPRRGEFLEPAKRVCDRCPVREACLDDDLAVVQATKQRVYGVRGGLSAPARIALLRRKADAS